jgi:hypothetical protein
MRRVPKYPIPLCLGRRQDQALGGELQSPGPASRTFTGSTGTGPHLLTIPNIACPRQAGANGRIAVGKALVSATRKLSRNGLLGSCRRMVGNSGTKPLVNGDDPDCAFRRPSRLRKRAQVLQTPELRSSACCLRIGEKFALTLCLVGSRCHTVCRRKGCLKSDHFQPQNRQSFAF